MTTETIDNPTWEDVREGDLVTVETGIEDAVGHKRYVIKGSPNVVATFRGDYWRVTKIVREVPDPLPDHAGDMALTDWGTALSDGDGSQRWRIGSTEHCAFYSNDELRNPVEALPVPAKELRELADSVTRNLIPAEIVKLASEFIAATRREWERAGIDGGLHD